MSFWDVHGVIFLLGLMVFPRITVFFFSTVTGGLLFWIAFLIVPRIFIAILAAYNYWDTNPILVILAFLWCLGGETTEKEATRRAAQRQ